MFPVVFNLQIIVDDCMTLIGSANINDRSQHGERDSEVAIFVRDTHTTPSRMADAPFESGEFGGALRRHLFREHLGLLPRQLSTNIGGGGGVTLDGVDHASASPTLPRRANGDADTSAPLTSTPLIDVADCASDKFWKHVWWARATESEC